MSANANDWSFDFGISREQAEELLGYDLSDDLWEDLVGHLDNWIDDLNIQDALCEWRDAHEEELEQLGEDDHGY